MAKSILSGDLEVYQVGVSDMVFSLKEARAEYSRLAKAARKRLSRLGDSVYSDTRLYNRYKGAFNPLSKDASEGEVRKALYEVARFTELKTSSISGMKAASLAAYKSFKETHDEGYEYIDKKNFETFRRFMGAVKSYYKNDKAFDSEEAVEDFEEFLKDAKDNDYDLDEKAVFDEWVEGKYGG